MNFISLFSGIGGFDLGFERAGMKVQGVCDVDKYALEVLARHFPDAKQYTDVREMGVNTHERNSIDVICGGFPCQDVSIAGKRKGLAGERSGLWHEFARIIDELEPRWVVVENVAGLLSSNNGRDFAVILRWLVERGYGVSWRVLDSQYFGVAQRRRRVFIVASFGNGSCAEVLFEREGVRWDPPPRSEAGQGTANTFTVRSGKDGQGVLSSSRMTAFGEYVPPVANTLAGGSSLAHSDMTSGQQDGNVILQTAVRRLTPTECSRLQGFPDTWNDWLSDTQRYKQLGNAVTVNVAEWIGKRIVEIDAIAECEVDASCAV